MEGLPIKYLLTFIFGVIFTQWIVPLVDGFINVLLQYFEAKKSPYVLQVQKDTNELTKLKQELTNEDNSLEQIGFVIPNEEEDDENDF